MTLTIDQILAMINSVFWPFVRIGAMFAAAPILGARSLPVQYRVLAALLIAWIITPLIPSSPSIQAFSGEGMMITVTQVIVGVAMGFILQMVFGAIVVAGQTLATSMGLGFAAAVDPQNGVQVPVVSQYFLILATLVFLALNGHLVLIETIVESFFLFPVGPVTIPENLPMQTVLWISETFQGRTAHRAACGRSHFVGEFSIWGDDESSPAAQHFCGWLPGHDSGGFHHDDAQPPRFPAEVFRLTRARICSDAGALWVIYG